MSYTILALETSLQMCSVSLYKHKKIFSIKEKCEKTHTLKIFPMIQKILYSTDTQLKELNAIAFSKGPGNFTSIRISASIAQGFSLILKIPIISISTLLLLAEQAWRKYHKKNILIAIKAQKKKIYWAQYQRNIISCWIGEDTEELTEIEIVEKKIKKLKNKWTLVGNGSIDILNMNSLNIQKRNIFFPRAYDIIPLALLAIKQKKTLTPTNSEPNYLNTIF